MNTFKNFLVIENVKKETQESLLEVAECLQSYPAPFHGIKQSLNKYIQDGKSELQVDSPWKNLLNSNIPADIITDIATSTASTGVPEQAATAPESVTAQASSFTFAKLSAFQRLLLVIAFRTSMFWPCAEYFQNSSIPIFVVDHFLRNLYLKDHFYYDIESVLSDIQKASRFFTVPIVFVRLASDAGMSLY